MENDPLTYAQDESRSRKGRLMGKLFGRERKASNEQNDGDINAFLHGPSDSLKVIHAAPPPLAKLDIQSAARYTNAQQYNSSSQQSLPLRPRSHSPRVNKSQKGLVVRFVDTLPEIIGEGGDESELPPAEVGRRKRARSAPAPPPPQRPADLGDQPRAYSELRQPPDAFAAMPLRRTQTGYSSISEAPERQIPAGASTSAPFLDPPTMSKEERRKSLIELQQNEGATLRSASASDQAGPVKTQSPPVSLSRGSPVTASQPPSQPESPDNSRSRKPNMEQSPASVYSTTSSLNYKQSSRAPDKEVSAPSSPLKTSMTLQDAVGADGSLDLFTTRTRHLYELFRLHSESVRPLLSCSADDLARAALWWFLQGRAALEAAVRERPPNYKAQQANEMMRQQAYADLAKGYWISEEVLPEILSTKQTPVDGEVDEARRSLMATLQKLCSSMKRNGFLPPEEAMLPQTIDKSIWIEYPKISNDVLTLLWGFWGSSALNSSEQPTPPMTLLESLPLGDAAHYFSFGRVPADAYLMEQGAQAQKLYFPCLLSMIRPLKQANIAFVITSQNGTVQLRIQNDRTDGPTWDDIRWRPDISAIDIRLPRGFKVGIQLSQQDYGLLWGMYEFGAKVQSTLFPRSDEQPAFRSTLKAFQYFDSDQQSRQFPKEAVPDCEVGLFERISSEKGPTGTRSYFLGFRLAVVTGTRNRTLAGVNHPYTPQTLVQFDFLRGKHGETALELKYGNSRTKGSMVLTFGNDEERLELHSLLVGTAIQHDEQIFAELPLLTMSISQSVGDPHGMVAFKKLQYQRLRVINREAGGPSGPPPTIAAARLRIVVESKFGTITDRVNVGPGELKLRLEVVNTNAVTVFRQPQEDMTAAMSKAQLERELGREFAAEMEGALQAIRKSQTSRTYQFGALQDLHAFQAALTGFNVIFDGVASTFAIARRRMVVPIHKKWEAGATRIQVVQQDKVTQLLAFFQDFHHGECMSFVLKGTDDYEAFSRSSKHGLKIEDAKFPLPKSIAEGGEDAAFVCLDMPDLPGEHDDISILFERESDRDQLISCLPAAVKNHRISRKY